MASATRAERSRWLRPTCFSAYEPVSSILSSRKGLASIARKFNLSWQECARYVGLSSYELLGKGVIDGVIDYAPEDSPPDVSRLQAAICSAIDSIEQATRNFVANEPVVLRQYARAVVSVT